MPSIINIQYCLHNIGPWPCIHLEKLFQKLQLYISQCTSVLKEIFEHIDGVLNIPGNSEIKVNHINIKFSLKSEWFNVI